MNAPHLLDSLAQVIRSTPGASGFSYTGFPIHQQLTNTAAVGDPVTFTGGPIRMHWAAEESNVTITTDYTLSYQDGKAIAAGVSVTTPAGSFTCSEWVYGRQLTIVTGPNNLTQNYSDTLWTAPGTPFVKTSELSKGVYTVTMLNKIN